MSLRWGVDITGLACARKVGIQDSTTKGPTPKEQCAISVAHTGLLLSRRRQGMASARAPFAGLPAVGGKLGSGASLPRKAFGPHWRSFEQGAPGRHEKGEQRGKRKCCQLACCKYTLFCHEMLTIFLCSVVPISTLRLQQVCSVCRGLQSRKPQSAMPLVAYATDRAS